MWLCILFPFALGLWILRLPFRQPKTFGPRRCKRCRYIVVGIPTPICPECGSDLRVTGTTTRDGYLPPTTAYLAVAWTLFSLFSILIPIAAVWTSLLDIYGFRQFNCTGDYYLSSTHSTIEWTQHQFAIDWSVHNIAFNPGIPQAVTVRLVQARNAPIPLPAAAPLQITGPLDQPGVTLQHIKAWMQTSGLNRYDPQFNNEAQAINIAARHALTHRANQNIHTITFPPELQVTHRGSGQSQSTSPVPYINLIPVALTLLIWIPGLHQIQKRRQRRK